MALLNSQKSDLFNAVKAGGFPATDFTFTEGTGSERTARLIYRDKRYLFNLRFVEASGIWKVNTIPGVDHFEESFDASAWNFVIHLVDRWLERLQRELSIPDPWVALENQLGPDFAVGGQNNAPLNVAEWEQAKEGIEKIRQVMIEDVKASPEAVKVISEKLDSLIEGGKRLGRVDWLNQAIGLLMNVIVAVGLSPEAQRTVWGILKGAVSGIVQLLPVVQKALGL